MCKKLIIEESFGEKYNLQDIKDQLEKLQSVENENRFGSGFSEPKNKLLVKYKWIMIYCLQFLDI